MTPANPNPDRSSRSANSNRAESALTVQDAAPLVVAPAPALATAHALAPAPAPGPAEKVVLRAPALFSSDGTVKLTQKRK